MIFIVQSISDNGYSKKALFFQINKIVTDPSHSEVPDNTSTTPSAPELNENLLKIIGEEIPEKQVSSPPFQKDVANRWTKMLQNGICSEEKDNLIKKYPPTENCPLLASPQINPEVANVINDQVKRRDEKLSSHQNQIGAALSALGQLLTNLLSEEGGAT